MIILLTHKIIYRLGIVWGVLSTPLDSLESKKGSHFLFQNLLEDLFLAMVHLFHEEVILVKTWPSQVSHEPTLSFLPSRFLLGQFHLTLYALSHLLLPLPHSLPLARDLERSCSLSVECFICLVLCNKVQVWLTPTSLLHLAWYLLFVSFVVSIQRPLIIFFLLLPYLESVATCVTLWDTHLMGFDTCMLFF